jgi:AcrR family transcriptional regulator
MKKKNSKNTKGKIVSAAWQLFYMQGYDDTTIDEIVEASGTSKGSFYHYFEGKDALLTSLSYLFDEKYEELIDTMVPTLSPIDKLVLMNKELFND